MSDVISHIKEYISQRQPALYRGLKKIALGLQSLATRSSEQEIIFTRIYRGGGWKSEHTVSGVGSTLASTDNIRNRLPDFLREYSIRTLLDIPCGDFHWMREVNLGTTKYIGGEIVKELVHRNRRVYETPDKTFLHLDILTSLLPDSDAILCRDCLPHLPMKEILRALKNIKRSSARYLITSHYPLCPVNEDIPMGRFRRINLERVPFFFPPPLVQWEDFDGRYADKTLALWRIAELGIPSSVS